MIRLTEIRIFPVKGLRGSPHRSATVERAGLGGDRRWLVVDQRGRFLTQREVSAMALVQAHNVPSGLHLSAPNLPPLEVATPPPDAPERHVVIWRDNVSAVSAGAHAGAWLSQALGLECGLVYMADPTTRPVDPAYAIPGDFVNFSDGFPVLLASLESLADLNSRLPSPVPMLRFRPNLVIDGAPAWAEDNWHRIRIGGAVFRVVKPCDRCVVTTIDPETGERPDPEEPLATLKTFRRDERGRVLFGQNLVPEVCGAISVGDVVELME